MLEFFLGTADFGHLSAVLFGPAAQKKDAWKTSAKRIPNFFGHTTIPDFPHGSVEIPGKESEGDEFQKINQKHQDSILGFWGVVLFVFL